jgi:hypothetical protein
VYILRAEAIERQKTGVEYAEVNGITMGRETGRVREFDQNKDIGSD